MGGSGANLDLTPLVNATNRLREGFQRWIASLKQVDLKPKPFLCMDGSSVQIRSAENEWPWLILKTAGSQSRAGRLKDAGVIARPVSGTLPRPGTTGRTDHATKSVPERAAQDVAGLSRRENNRIERGEYEPERIEIERHARP